MMPIRYFSFLIVGIIISTLFSLALDYNLEQGLINMAIVLASNTFFYIITGGEDY